MVLRLASLFLYLDDEQMHVVHTRLLQVLDVAKTAMEAEQLADSSRIGTFDLNGYKSYLNQDKDDSYHLD